ncbi:DUF3800 domain-containing protein [Streptomyces sp. NBC_00820]|uniref:DUF3800 domain-containing protein n=1 Tax=Streptomyces sp. NBC_00820 TaxID=2975842 RepID=UPI002ED6AC9D|nr:DUF3800 domain-containing protein [Streptomyces sp. NBC_00820]
MLHDVVVLMAYIDESGNTGAVEQGGTLTYTLGCVLIEDHNWATSFDEAVAFRRRLRDKFGVLMRSELKANFLLRNSGSIRHLGIGPRGRQIIYRAHMRALVDLKAKAFAIIIDKRAVGLSDGACFELAWTTLMQRLERASHAAKTPIMIFHDEGEDDHVRRLVRKSRRHMTAGSAYGTGSINVPAWMLLDDPVPRRSDHSYFIQFADLAAHAAFRAYVPPSRAVSSVCPADMWLELGDAMRRETNRMSGGPAPRIVVRKS